MKTRLHFLALGFILFAALSCKKNDNGATPPTLSFEERILKSVALKLGDNSIQINFKLGTIENRSLLSEEAIAAFEKTEANFFSPSQPGLKVFKGVVKTDNTKTTWFYGLDGADILRVTVWPSINDVFDPDKQARIAYNRK